MNKTRRIGWVVAAAVAAISFGNVVSPAAAQHRVGSDGRALDANNRIGSGGINDAPPRGPVPGAIGNQIVTGNVTAGQQFRGAVPYTDPFAFRGVTGGLGSDRFIRESAGVPIPGVATQNNANIVRPFYGMSETVAPPPGYALQAPGTGYVPAPTLMREPGDLRLGRTFDTPQTVFPQPGQLVLPGPVDPSTEQPTVITASPLYGVRQWNFGQQTDQEFLNGLNLPPSQRARLDERTLQRLREDLRRDELRPDEEGLDDGTLPGAGVERRRDTLTNAFERDRLSLSLTDSTRVDDRMPDRIQTDVAPGNLSVRTPERQSAQYAEMQRRLNRFNQLPEAVAQWEEHRRHQARLRGEEQPDAIARRPLPGDEQPRSDRLPQPGDPAAQPGTGTDPQARQPGAPGIPGLDLPDYRQRSRDILEGRDLTTGDLTDITGADRDQDVQRDRTRDMIGATDAPPQPLQVESLATGVQARALADILKEAEGLMREGKFYSALDQYEMADQVAPNDPMVNLGRAIAELGASYYARADQHLRDAFTRDPALLMAQYDLQGFLGEERLKFLMTDLRAISNKETAEPRSVFLLAFIDYNTGNPRRAAAYLDLAERRAGKPDPLYQAMRKYWSLPPAQEGGTGTDATETNK